MLGGFGTLRHLVAMVWRVGRARPERGKRDDDEAMVKVEGKRIEGMTIGENLDQLDLVSIPLYAPCPPIPDVAPRTPPARAASAVSL